MKCSECEYTEEIQRKYGKTTHCTIDPTHMDVTFYVQRRSGIGEDNLLCPLLRKEKRHIKDSTELSGGVYW